MRPIVLTILDGWGYSPQKVGNAIASARTPNMDFILHNYPSLLLQASGKAVGLTWGETGNSEVGHLTIGAGRVIFQYLSRINQAIETEAFYTNEAFIRAINHVQQNSSTLHFAGLLTSGSVHAYFGHILGLMELAKRHNVQQAKIHLFLDGKDSGLKEGKALITKLQDYVKNYPNVKIATAIGRDFAMDRNANWDLTEKSYRLMTRMDGEKTEDIIGKLDELYAQGMHDNRIPPLVLDPSGAIQEGDGLIFFNFREDSMRQISRSFVEKELNNFERVFINNLLVVEMTEYIQHPDILVAFPVPEIKNGLAEYLSLNGKKQFHIAENEKYDHVTYFFNGLKNKPYEGQTNMIIKSTRKPEEEPQMMANEILAASLAELEKDQQDFMVINFANADMLAHSGNLEQAIKGIEVVDACIGKLREAVFQKQGILIITADHGNAESLTYKGGGEAETKHNLSPVPFFIVVKEYERPRSEQEIKQSLASPKGIIADVAPTIVQIFGLPQPPEMTGESLFKVLG